MLHTDCEEHEQDFFLKLYFATLLFFRQFFVKKQKQKLQYVMIDFYRVQCNICACTYPIHLKNCGEVRDGIHKLKTDFP